MSATETPLPRPRPATATSSSSSTDVHTYYGTIQALKGITLEVLDGEIVTLIGANGAGKSTTLRSINGLNHPREGTIEFQGTDITNKAASRHRAHGHLPVARGTTRFPSHVGAREPRDGRLPA